MKTPKLLAQKRDITKKKVKALRKKGLLPAAIFGYKGNFNVQLKYRDFHEVYSKVGHTGILDVDLDGTLHSVLVSEVQVHPVSRNYIHVTLREVKMDEEITAYIPLTLVGVEQSPAVKEQQQIIILSLNDIELRGLPKALPHEISIDVSNLHAGETVLLKDIKLPDGVTLVHDDEESLNQVIVTTSSAQQDELTENVQEAIKAGTEAEMSVNSKNNEIASNDNNN